MFSAKVILACFESLNMLLLDLSELYIQQTRYIPPRKYVPLEIGRSHRKSQKIFDKHGIYSTPAIILGVMSPLPIYCHVSFPDLLVLTPLHCVLSVTNINPSTRPKYYSSVFLGSISIKKDVDYNYDVISLCFHQSIFFTFFPHRYPHSLNSINPVKSNCKWPTGLSLSLHYHNDTKL